MKRILKSTCAFVLSLCIVVTFMPTAVFAVTEPVDEDTAVVTEEMDADQAEPEAVVEAEDDAAEPEEVVLEPVSDEEMEEVLAEQEEAVEPEPAAEPEEVAPAPEAPAVKAAEEEAVPDVKVEAAESEYTLELGKTVDGTLPMAADYNDTVVWYKFTTTSNRAFYMVSIMNPETSEYIKADIYDSNKIDYEDYYNASAGPNKQADLIAKLPKNTVFYVKVYGNDRNKNHPFKVSVTEIKDTDAGDTYQDSKTVGIKTVYSGKINVSKDDYDWYKFVAPAKGTFRVRISNKQTADNAYMYVSAYNSNVTTLGDEVFIDHGKKDTIDLKATAKGQVFYVMMRGSYNTPSYSFSIGRVATGSKVTLSKTSYTYDGKYKKPTVTVKFNGTKLVKDTDYTLSYKNNKKVGSASVTINFKGKYAGSKTVRYTIKTRKTSFTSASGKYKQLHMKWSKRSEAEYYQIQYSTSKSFKSKKTETWHINEWYSPTLKSGKYYYVRIRTGKDIYQSYDGKTHKYRSGWSKVKRVYVKK